MSSKFIIRPMEFKLNSRIDNTSVFVSRKGVVLHVPDTLDIQDVFRNPEYSKYIKDPLNERVRRFREVRKWTQRDLAVAAGITQGEVSAIEGGQTLPGLAVLSKLQKAFDLDAAFFTIGGGNATA